MLRALRAVAPQLLSLRGARRPPHTRTAPGGGASLGVRAELVLLDDLARGGEGAAGDAARHVRGEVRGEVGVDAAKSESRIDSAAPMRVCTSEMVIKLVRGEVRREVGVDAASSSRGAECRYEEMHGPHK